MENSLPKGTEFIDDITDQYKDLLNGFRKVNSLPKRSKRTAKRLDETDKNYVIRKAGFRCSYCLKKIRNNKVRVIKKDDNLKMLWKVSQYNMRTHRKDPELPKVYNGTCLCLNCYVEKKELGLGHIEYMYLLKKRKNEVRNEILDNPKIRSRIFKRDGYVCHYCKIEQLPISRKVYLSLDHKNPVSMGGTNEDKNLCCSCLFHNTEKGNTPYGEYIKKIQKRRKQRDCQLA